MAELLLPITAILIGFIGLIWSADRFVAGSASIAKLAGLSPLIIGLTIVSLGTSAPEIIVSLSASLSGSGDLAIGNALGSNLANIGLVLGTTALVARLPIQKHLLKQEIPILLLVTAIAGAFLWDARLVLHEGLILLFLIVPLISFLIIIKRKTITPEEAAEEEEIEELSPQKSIFFFALGLGLLIGSSETLVYGAKAVAVFYNVSPLIIGLTVIAVGTSLPELAASVVSAIKGHHDIALGNVIGSNIFNLLAVMSLPGIIGGVEMAPEVLNRDYLSVAGITGVMAAVIYFSFLSHRDKSKAGLGKVVGVSLLAIYALYYVVLFQQTAA